MFTCVKQTVNTDEPKKKAKDIKTAATVVKRVTRSTTKAEMERAKTTKKCASKAANLCRRSLQFSDDEEEGTSNQPMKRDAAAIKKKSSR